MTNLSRWGAIAVTSAIVGCGASGEPTRVHDVTPTSGDYGTTIHITDVHDGAFVSFRTHTTDLLVPVRRSGERDGEVRFPFPATGEMELWEAGVVPLASFKPSVTLPPPLKGAFQVRDLKDSLLARGRTVLLFDGAIVVAEPDGKLSRLSFDVGPVPMKRGALVDDGAFYVTSGIVQHVTLSDDRTRAAVESTNVFTNASIVAAGREDGADYFWTDVDAARVGRFSADGRPLGPLVPLPNEVVSARSANRIRAASVGPDGTLWLGWAADAKVAFDDAEEIRFAALHPGETVFGASRMLVRVQDEVESLVLRATVSGFDYTFCGHDLPSLLDTTDQRYCESGRSDGSTPRPTLRDDASMNVRCSSDDRQTQRLDVLRGERVLLALDSCDRTSILSMSSAAQGATRIVALNDGALYSFEVGAAR